ncbi:MAG: flagellar hook-basal body complex protein FliE [Clostridia bacterium]|nr:flagellar hook-basal body complex protein FliE [Clostridia bacterium]
MAINKIGGINLFTPSSSGLNSIAEDDSSKVNFGDYLKNALDKVSDMQLGAEKLTNDFASGRTDNIHEVLIAGEKADVALQFTMQIRNKILDAYNEIMRIQI